MQHVTVTVSEAVGSNCVATISCTLEHDEELDCDHIEHVVCSKGRKIIPGLYYCTVQQNKKDIIFTLGYFSSLSQEEIKGRLYAVVYSSMGHFPELESISPRSVDIKRNF